MEDFIQLLIRLVLGTFILSNVILYYFFNTKLKYPYTFNPNSTSFIKVLLDDIKFYFKIDIEYKNNEYKKYYIRELFFIFRILAVLFSIFAFIIIFLF